MTTVPSQGKSITITGLQKKFGAFKAVDDFSLTVAEGEFVSLLGPSGCGKTTTLKMLSGLLIQDEGEIRFGDRRVDLLPSNKRNIGLVFQNYALFPHMTVAENISFGLRMRGWSKAKQRDRVEAMLRLVRLEGLGERKPEQLSGGQQQRVAVARALAFEPDLVLLDEPLSNLDAKLREQVRLDLREIQKKSGQTTVFVTHDQVEAMVMSDRIVLMNGGRIDQIGTPFEIYALPWTEFGARFVGAGNMLEAELDREGAEPTATLAGGIRIPVQTLSPLMDERRGPVWCRVRPEDVEIHVGDDQSKGTLQGRLVDVVYQGTTVMVDIDVGPVGVLRAERPAGEFGAVAVGMEAGITLVKAHAVPRQP